MNNPELTWLKSSYSSQGNCVEVAARDHVLVRDTKQRSTGPVLRFTPTAWRRFADQVKRR
jgi:hypothetical protein